MTDTAPATDNRKRKIVNGIILSGWIITLIAMLAIMGSALYLVVQGHEVPKTLEQWAGMALGFLFGTFNGVVKEYVS